MVSTQMNQQKEIVSPGSDFGKDAFSRPDETDDSLFYSRDRFVSHLDSLALSTVETLIGELIIEDSPTILDLMAGWDSHIPKTIKPSKVAGLGLNENELRANEALSEYVIHDLNKDLHLPFSDDVFDAAINTVSVDYVTKPIELFREVRRILRPGGLFLVIFSNRFFPPKVVKIWRQSSEPERVILVEEFFKASGGFEAPKVFVSAGRPRPRSDKYAHLGIPSDPIYAVYADKKGGNPTRKPRPQVPSSYSEGPDKSQLEARMKAIKHTLLCPYCGERMSKWAVSQTPFTEWENEHMYVCFNDECPYFVRGWDAMNKQGNRGMSYRCMYHPVRDRCMPIPVPSLHALKAGIVE